jgi:hypothetical protein
MPAAFPVGGVPSHPLSRGPTRARSWGLRVSGAVAPSAPTMPEGVVGLSHTQYSADADGSAPAGRVKRPIMRTAAHPLGMTRKGLSARSKISSRANGSSPTPWKPSIDAFANRMPARSARRDQAGCGQGNASDPDRDSRPAHHELRSLAASPRTSREPRAAACVEYCRCRRRESVRRRCHPRLTGKRRPARSGGVHTPGQA